MRHHLSAPALGFRIEFGRQGLTCAFQDKAWDMFRKELEPGRLRYPENQVAILISEAHRDRAVDGTEIIPTETTFSEAGAKNPVAVAFAKELLGRWAEYNQAIASELPGMVREVETRDPAKLFNPSR
jgi:hypothetical protein